MDRKFLSTGMAAVLALLSTLPAVAGYSSWTSQGPDGGEITSVVIAAPGTLYAAVLDGVMKSADGGLTWQRALTDTLASGPFSLAVDPADPLTVYAGGREGLYKTVDGGAAWSPVNLAIRNVQQVAISPLAPHTVWVGGSGFYVSRDSGETWSAVAGGYPAGGLTRKVVLDPAQPGVAYASTYGGSEGGLFKTADDGGHWTRIHTEAPAALAIDPLHPWKLYAGGMSTISGLLRSRDGGATWAHLDNAMGNLYVSVLAVDPRTSAVYAALPLSAPHGLYRSLDGGDTWTGVGSSLPSAWPYEFAFAPDHLGVLFLGSSAGVWTSIDGGTGWTPCSRGIAGLAYAVAIAPSDPRTVYAGAGPNGFFRSNDRGETWSILVTKNLNVNQITKLVVDPTRPEAVLATTDAGLFQSLDRGETWRRLGSMAPVYDVALDPGSASTLYVAGATGAYRSTDGGTAWARIWPQEGPGTWVRHLTVSPARPADVYLTTPAGLLASRDRGGHWTQLPYPGGEPLRVVADPARPAVLYVLEESALTKSDDGGLTWTTSFPTTGSITTAAVDPVTPDTVYCATWNHVFRSTDGGGTWSALSLGLGDTILTDLALEHSETVTLHLSTFTGVFELTEITPPPPGEYLTARAFPGFQFKVLITAPGEEGVVGRVEPNCPAQTLCVSGDVRRRTDVRIQVDGGRLDGPFTVSVTRFTRSQVEVWVERLATGDRRYYRLAAVVTGR